jgi:hypothetical protein
MSSATRLDAFTSTNAAQPENLTQSGDVARIKRQSFCLKARVATALRR